MWLRAAQQECAQEAARRAVGARKRESSAQLQHQTSTPASIVAAPVVTSAAQAASELAQATVESQHAQQPEAVQQALLQLPGGLMFQHRMT